MVAYYLRTKYFPDVTRALPFAGLIIRFSLSIISYTSRTTGNYQPNSDSSNRPTSEAKKNHDQEQEELEQVLEEEILEEEVLVDLDSSAKTPRKRKSTNPINQDIDERIQSILAKAESSISQPKPARHATFCSYLTERMEMLPLAVARELEVEFTCRVNSLISLHDEEFNHDQSM